ncbi:uncharacterized protein M6B38_266230 [Iris pallida]|uniref:AAA+ ATPase domain-containing protein n=1 Tax=Iris pallida TaxID=29817 RepID=A0AAX6IAU1_IRIPA|nr:uncharacterized protein M6B38_266230 [Iris pallida]
MAETIVKEEEQEEHAKAPPAQPGPDQEPAPWRRTAAGDIQVSLESFPYHLCETTKEVLRSSAYLHLVCKKKFAAQVPSLSRLLRLYGPSGSEIYQETLAMALAKQFGATLLIFDPLPQPVDSSLAAGATTADTQAADTDTRGGILPIVSRLVKFASEECKSGPLVVFLSDIFVNDIKKSIAGSVTMFSMLKDHLDKLPAGVLVIGSRVHEEEKSHSSHRYLPSKSKSKQEHKKESTKKKNKKLGDLFPHQVTIRIPRDEDQVARWKNRLDQDAGTLRARRNNARIRSALELIGWSCSDLETNRIDARMLSDESVSRVVGYAVMHHLESRKPDAGDVLSSDSIRHGFDLLEAIKRGDESPKKSLKDVVVTANVFEKKLLDVVVPPEELRVGFEDVGGLDDVKEALRESVILPLRRPELFSRGQLRNPCKRGILLFGPPGTGKTLLARAVAAEAGANLINLSTSSSRWHGDAERYARAAFALASKIAPSVVFVDEIDAMMSSSRGGSGEHKSSLRAFKNEFMMNWDRLDVRQVLILAASNKPYDLDEDVLRRFPRRLMVGLPDSSDREKILRVVLSEEELAPDVDLVAVANTTDGYSGGDLRELCVVAARCAIREVLEKERSSASSGSGGVGVRAFGMDDFRYARGHVGAASTSSGSAGDRKLGEWSNRYGEGGSRKKQVPSYFL